MSVLLKMYRRSIYLIFPPSLHFLRQQMEVEIRPSGSRKDIANVWLITDVDRLLLVYVAVWHRKGPVTLHWQMQRGYKTFKKIFPSVEKCTYSLRTYFIHSTNQASVHCDFIRAKSFELHKTFWTDELSTVYNVNLQHIHVRATNGPCPLSFGKLFF